MTKPLKQTAGIDVAQKELVVSLGRMNQDTSTEIYAFKVFSNNPKGFIAMEQWVQKQAEQTSSVNYVMESTGVYHQNFAYYLADRGHKVSVVLPNKISNYHRTLDVKTITDKTASQTICRFGLERKLDNWIPPKREFRTLKQLTRERDQLIAERTFLKNQLHAENAEAFPNPASISRINERILLINRQEKEIRADILAIINGDEALTKQTQNLISIPGIGLLTAVSILAETNGFELIRNKKQLVSYAGLDVRSKESGTSVHGKARISKKGNRFLRKAMYLPALCAIRHDVHFKAIFVRLVAKHGIKMKAAVAVQRKLLELTYIIWKSGKPYQAEYYQNLIEQIQAIK